MSAFVRIEVEWHGELPVASIHGEIDASNVAEVRTRLRNLVTNHHMGLMIDLSPTDYLDSTGVNLLFAIGSELAGRQQTLRIVIGDAAPVRRVVRITGLDRAYPTYATGKDALAAAER